MKMQMFDLILDDFSLLDVFNKNHLNRKKFPSRIVELFDFSEELFSDNEENVLVISDPHFFHRNSITWNRRNHFNSIEEMNETIFQNISNTINNDSTLIWLGDISITNKTNQNILRERISNLPGNHFHIIGNHDYHKGKLIDYGFSKVLLFMVINDKILTHQPLNNIPEGYKNIHGHLHEKILPNHNYINVSVECTEFKPVKLYEL